MTSVTNSPDIVGYDSKNPVLFKVRGLEPDIRLKVFEAEFHVHSTILKMHSHYFFTFLDSADKSNLSGDTTKFKYDWVTKVDDDGEGWQLVSVGPNAGDLKHKIYREKRRREIMLFNRLLHAIYRLPFNRFCGDIDDWHSYRRIVEMAKFYACLPVLSQSLRLLLPPLLVGYELDIDDGVKWTKCALLETICDLRWPELFRDTLILAMGPWSNPRFKQLPPSKLKDLCQLKYDEHCITLWRIQQAMLLEAATEKFEETPLQLHNGYLNTALVAATKKKDNGELEVHWPVYFRYLFNNVTKNGPWCADLHHVVQNMATMQYSEVQVGHVSDRREWYSDYFLCFEVKNAELPWDTKQTDW